MLYIAAGLPTVAVTAGMLNVSLFNSFSGRLLALENKVDTKLSGRHKLAALTYRLSGVQQHLSN